jgi:hypothetical protein
MHKFYSKYFEPVKKPYMVCVCKGTFAGRVGDVVGISNAFFSISKAGLALVKFDNFKYNVPIPVEALINV